MTRESPEIPLACSLSDPELRDREATLLAEFKSGVISSEELPDGYVFRIPGDKKWIAVVAELIAEERECCPFLTFTLTVSSQMGPVDLRVTGPVGVKDFLRGVLIGPK
jgi:hypothetical protein